MKRWLHRHIGIAKLVCACSVFTAIYGMRLPWEKLRRTGDVQLPAASTESGRGG